MAIDNAARGLALKAQTTATAAASQSATVANAVTFDNSGSGAVSGTTYNGSAAKTVSTNTIGALKASNNLSDVSALNTAITNLQSVYEVGQSAVLAANTGNTTENTLATASIPAPGANGRIEIKFDFSSASGTSAKTVRIKLAGTTIATITVGAAQLLANGILTISNRNATGSQRWSAVYHLTTGAGPTISSGTSSIDLSAGATLTITAQLATGTDTVTLESYQAALYPKA